MSGSRSLRDFQPSATLHLDTSSEQVFSKATGKQTSDAGPLAESEGEVASVEH